MFRVEFPNVDLHLPVPSKFKGDINNEMSYSMRGLFARGCLYKKISIILSLRCDLFYLLFALTINVLNANPNIVAYF